jgi:hypothetical protein
VPSFAPRAAHRRSQEHGADAPQRPTAHQGKSQLLVAVTDLNVSLTAELKSHNAGDGG